MTFHSLLVQPLNEKTQSDLVFNSKKLILIRHRIYLLPLSAEQQPDSRWLDGLFCYSCGQALCYIA